MSLSPDLRELYQEVILDHARTPRNFLLPEPHNRSGEGYNPLCGDKITLRAQVDGEVITDVGFQGQGCAISTAAASTLTDEIKGKTVGDFERLLAHYLAVVRGSAEPDEELLGKLAVFAGVSEFPMRVKCATLAWHTLKAALDRRGDPVTTE
jgi:nitrogen fixation NifU-like protein